MECSSPRSPLTDNLSSPLPGSETDSCGIRGGEELLLRAIRGGHCTLDARAGRGHHRALRRSNLEWHFQKEKEEGDLGCSESELLFPFFH